MAAAAVAAAPNCYMDDNQHTGHSLGEDIRLQHSTKDVDNPGMIVLVGDQLVDKLLRHLRVWTVDIARDSKKDSLKVDKLCYCCCYWKC